MTKIVFNQTDWIGDWNRRQDTQTCLNPFQRHTIYIFEIMENKKYGIYAAKGIT